MDFKLRELTSVSHVETTFIKLVLDVLYLVI